MRLITSFLLSLLKSLKCTGSMSSSTRQLADCCIPIIWRHALSAWCGNGSGDVWLVEHSAEMCYLHINSFLTSHLFNRCSCPQILFKMKAIPTCQNYQNTAVAKRRDFSICLENMLPKMTPVSWKLSDCMLTKSFFPKAEYIQSPTMKNSDRPAKVSECRCI